MPSPMTQVNINRSPLSSYLLDSTLGRIEMTRLISALALTLICGTTFAALPVVPAKDQAALLKSSDAKLAANKKIAYDFFRVVLRGLHLDQADKYMKDD